MRLAPGTGMICRTRLRLHVVALMCSMSALPALASGAGGASLCRPDDLPGLSRQFERAERESRPEGAVPGGARGLAPAAAADFWRVARAVLGPEADLLSSAGLTGEVAGWPPASPLPCAVEVRARDAMAWRLALGGYSAIEIADVLGGHLTVADLDEARRRLMAGQPRALVTAFLESRWRDAAPPPAAAAAAPPPASPTLGDLDDDLESLARAHAVEPALVRAVIAAESAGNPRAVSPAGAIGLMQLMPGTAAALGVDPWQPRENLRGGIAYLASLLRTFDDTRLALIAYNAGPSHARDVAAGRAVAYRETRRYLDAIGARFPLP